MNCTPNVTTNAGGIPSLIEDGKTGFLYPYSEPHALAFKIMNLHGQKDILEQVSRNEIDCSRIRHNQQDLAKRIMEIYNDICQNQKDM